MIPKSRAWKPALAGAIAALVALGAGLAWHRTQDFLSEVRVAAQSGVGAALLCDARDARACRTLTRDTVLLHLSQAAPVYLPGKSTVKNEWILRLRRRAGNGHVACYRVVDYDSYPDLRLYRVAMDPACERVERYLPGVLAVPRHAFGASAP